MSKDLFKHLGMAEAMQLKKHQENSFKHDVSDHLPVLARDISFNVNQPGC
jgi:hypothetical protein